MRNADTEIRYGDFGSRLLAVILDTLIMLPVGLAMLNIFAGNPLLATIASFVLNGMYYSVFLSGKWRATPGKRLLSLMVVDADDGSSISGGHAWGRYLAYQIPGLAIYSNSLPEPLIMLLILGLSAAWYLPIFFDKERAGTHDKLCRTRVIMGRI